MIGKRKVNVKDYPAHPRVLLSFTSNLTEFINALSEFALRLPHNELRHYKRWPLLSSMGVAMKFRATTAVETDIAGDSPPAQDILDEVQEPKKTVTFFNPARRSYLNPLKVHQEKVTKESFDEVLRYNSLVVNLNQFSSKSGKDEKSLLSGVAAEEDINQVSNNSSAKSSKKSHSIPSPPPLNME